MNDRFESISSYGDWSYGLPSDRNAVVQPAFDYPPLPDPGPSHPPSEIPNHFVPSTSDLSHAAEPSPQRKKRSSKRKKTDRPLLDQIQTGDGPVVLYDPYPDRDPEDMYVPNGSFEEDIPQDNVDEFIDAFEFETEVESEPPKRKRGSKKANSSLEGENLSPVVDARSTKGRVLKLLNGPFKGENDFYWETEPPKRKIEPSDNLRLTPGPTGEAARARTPLECFKLFLDDTIVDSIISNTNVEIEVLSSRYARKNDTNLSPFAVDEFSAFLSLLILGGVLQNNHLRCETLFNPTYCGDQYRATMNVSRFQFIAGALTFDAPERNRSTDKKDKLAPVERIWNKFLDNCKKHYVPSACVTVGKQILSYRGPCPFVITVHTPVVKHGMQMFLLVDNATKYLINALPYLGRDVFPSDASLGSFVVNKLIDPIKGSWRTVTMDEWFTTISLAQELLEESQLTMIGQIKKNRKELPTFFVDSKFKQRKNGSSLFLHNDDVTAVSYKPCNNTGLILVISTCTNANSLKDNSKPEVICKYEATRGAVEALESLCERTNVSRKSLKWQCAFFFNMLNVALHNAYVIYCHNWTVNNPKVPKSRMMQRTEFAFDLVSNLSRTWMQVRLGFNLSNGLRLLIKRCLKMDDDEEADNACSETLDSSTAGDPFVLGMSNRKTCNVCPSSIRRRTRNLCCYCTKPICNEHTRRMCVSCHLAQGGQENGAKVRKTSKKLLPRETNECGSDVEGQENGKCTVEKKTKRKCTRKAFKDSPGSAPKERCRPYRGKGRPPDPADDLIEQVRDEVPAKTPKRKTNENLTYLLELEYSSSSEDQSPEEEFILP